MSDNDRLTEAIRNYFRTERNRPAQPLSRLRLARAMESARLRQREPAAFWKMAAWSAVAAIVALMVFPAFDTPVATIAEGVNWVWDVDGVSDNEMPDSISRAGLELNSIDEQIDRHDTSSDRLTTADSTSDDDGDGDVDWIFQDDQG